MNTNEEEGILQGLSVSQVAWSNEGSQILMDNYFVFVYNTI